MTLSDNLDVFVWGKNHHGQLGLGPQGGTFLGRPEAAKHFPGQVKQLSTGPSHALALLDDNGVYGWGMQSNGRLGLIEKKNVKIIKDPTKVKAEWASIEAMSGVMAAAKAEQGQDADDDVPAEGDDAGAGKIVDA